MSYRILLIGLLNIGLFANASAQPYWLNMVTNGESMSLPVSSSQSCSDAVMQYVRSNIVNFVSCDIEPLPDAVNIGI
jgi:hypothetical protein